MPSMSEHTGNISNKNNEWSGDFNNQSEYTSLDQDHAPW